MQVRNSIRSNTLRYHIHENNNYYKVMNTLRGVKRKLHRKIATKRSKRKKKTVRRYNDLDRNKEESERICGNEPAAGERPVLEAWRLAF